MQRPIRHAASLIAGRDAPGGVFQVLVVERGAGARFLPGYVAFPGGAVDDADTQAAARWFGDPGEASRAAAVRELAEETAIDLVGIDASALPQICRWVAPEEVPVRFDARYFAADVPSAEPVPDGGETAAAWWADPVTLLGEWEAGDRKLYWPTWLTMTHVAGCRAVADLLALRFEPREPTPDEAATMPRSVMEQDP